jgi:hypothetical protein
LRLAAGRQAGRELRYLSEGIGGCRLRETRAGKSEHHRGTKHSPTATSESKRG